MMDLKRLVKITWTAFIFVLSSWDVFSRTSAGGDTVSVIGTGDIMLGSNYPSEAKLPPNDGKDLLRNVKDILRDANVTFGNLEGCFLDSGGTPKSCKSGCYFFRMPERYVNHLLDAGFDVMNIANNHMGDFGPRGRENTVKVLKDSGLHYAGLEGVCETAQFEIDGVKYGFCGFAPNSGTVRITDLAKAKRIVAELDKENDLVIVSFHGGAEGKAHNRVPRKTETFYGENRGNVYEFAHAVIDAGADIVFGHGPHVVRAAELYKDRFIIYSMGNFCTSGDFSISGISGYAPIVKVYTDREGKFIRGHLFSALQKDKTGPVLDAGHLAAKEIKRLTEQDFPETGLTVSAEGVIERKEDWKAGKENPVSDAEPSSALALQHDSLRIGGNVVCNRPADSALALPHDSLPAYVQTADTLQTAGHDSTTLTQNIIDFSKRFIGHSYRRGSKGPETFDCSGFTSFVFKEFGYQLSPSCVTQVKQGTQVVKEELKTGDLIFFKGRNITSSRVGHVGIVVSNDENGNVVFIHACRRGVKMEELNKSPYYKPRYVTGLRILEKNT